jgi:hypothetical protein
MDLSATTGKNISGNNMLQQGANIETAIMPFKLQQLVEVIMEKKLFGVEDAFHYLYTSNCYQLLLREDTKLWYMSALGIFELLEEEKKSEKTDSRKLLLFYAFCLEKFKDFSKMSAEETLLTFRKYRVFDYLRDGFEVLHTQGENYILSEIDLFIKARK